MNTVSWWQTREPRERRLLVGAALASVGLAVYGLLWLPFSERLAALNRSVNEDRQRLTWMRQAARDIERLSAAGSGRVAVTDGGSLAAAVDQSVRSAGLAAALRRLEPQPDGQLSLRFEQAEFDTLVRWLATLAAEYGLQVSSAVIDTGTAVPQGRVDARLVLRAGQG